MKKRKNKLPALMLALAVALVGVFPGAAAKAAEASAAKSEKEV